MAVNIPYKSFCWGLGTTSFRTKNFNKTIEEQLTLLDEFWALPENQNSNWTSNNELQARYYDFMKDKGFVKGEAKNKPKDAREKTSGLVDIGLINNNRKITPAGDELLAISRTGDFSTDNTLQIDKDSFVYLKQLLKTFNCVNGDIVRPFIILLYLLSKLDYLTLDEYTYLLPLCTDVNNTEYIRNKILEYRQGRITIDEIIVDKLLSMDNYNRALSLFLNNNVDEELICTIGMNRKSRNYDKPYLPLYNELYNLFVSNNLDCALNVFEATKKVKIGKLWRSYLFDTISTKLIEKDPIKHIKRNAFSDISNEQDFKIAFFKVMHLMKAKATLSDYLDLNRRYIKTTEVIIFEDELVKIDIIPKQFFYSVIDSLYLRAFEESDLLFAACELTDIDPVLTVNETSIIEGINAEFNVNVTTIDEAYGIVNENRYQRFNHLIDEKFTDDKLIILLDLFKSRNDNEIRNMVTDNADIPTIFEYVLGIIWYKISDRQGDILSYMKLSLEADLLPKTHAGGGEADLVYEYPQTQYYPQHSLLIEATLATDTNQRRMEMEPVSRHLGKHLIKTGNMNSYCVFITPYLDINVIADFRSRKTTPFYDQQDYSKSVNGMKIIPLQTSELKKIVSNGKTYKELYSMFEEAFNSKLPPHIWYNETLLRSII